MDNLKLFKEDLITNFKLYKDKMDDGLEENIIVESLGQLFDNNHDLKEKLDATNKLTNVKDLEYLIVSDKNVIIKETAFETLKQLPNTKEIIEKIQKFVKSVDQFEKNRQIYKSESKKIEKLTSGERNYQPINLR